MDANLLKLCPPTMMGWNDDLNHGEPMQVEPGPDHIHMRITVTSRGVTMVALGDDPNAARLLLEKSLLRPEQVKKMLCG